MKKYFLYDTLKHFMIELQERIGIDSEHASKYESCYKPGIQADLNNECF